MRETEGTVDITAFKDGLSWELLSSGTQQGILYVIGNYTAQQHLTGGQPTAFMVFKKRLTKLDSTCSDCTLKRDADNQPKLHIALNGENIEHAFNLILNELFTKNVECFKVVLASKLSELENAGQAGKIFTVYDTDGVNLQELAYKIDQNLREFNIPIPRKLATECTDVSRQDITIPKCQFVTLAAPRRRGLLTIYAATFNQSHERRPSGNTAPNSRPMSTLLPESGSGGSFTIKFI